MNKKDLLIKFQKKILNGKELSSIILDSIKIESDYIINKFQLSPPHLKIIQIGNKSDSTLYVTNKIRCCSSIGWKSTYIQLNNDVSLYELLSIIQLSNEDNEINGIIIQLPLPIQLEPYKLEILNTITITKDIDGLNPVNMGKNIEKKNHISRNEMIDIPNSCLSSLSSLSSPINTKDLQQINDNLNYNKEKYDKIKDKNLFCIVPPTALGVMELLRLGIYFQNSLLEYKKWACESQWNQRKEIKRDFNLIGYDSTVLGRSIIAGLPISILLEKLNSTVTTCHALTKDKDTKIKNCDILVSAVGKVNLVKNENVNKDSIVIDVGINIFNGKVVGDCDFESIIHKVKFISPVPNGVGRMTVVMLLSNLLKVWKYQNKIYI